MKQLSSAGRYRQLCEPHESALAANAEIDAFIASVGVLREKHRLPDVILIFQVRMMGDEGESIQQTGMAWGDAERHETMVARAAGEMASKRQHRLSDAMRDRAIMRPHSGDR